MNRCQNFGVSNRFTICFCRMWSRVAGRCKQWHPYPLGRGSLEIPRGRGEGVSLWIFSGTTHCDDVPLTAVIVICFVCKPMMDI